MISADVRSMGREHWRVPVAATVAAVGGVGAWLLAVSGSELAFGLCAFGGCSEPKNAGVGNAMLAASLICGVGSLVLPVRVATRGDHGLARALSAFPAVAIVGMAALVLGADRRSGAEQNIAIVALIVAYVSVLTVRPDRWWAAGVLAAATVAAILGRSVPASVMTATAVFLGALAVRRPSMNV